MSKCRHNWKPVAKHGPLYVWPGVYAGEDWSCEDGVLACVNCGKRRASAMASLKHWAIFAIVGMCWVAGLALLGSLSVMMFRVALQ